MMDKLDDEDIEYTKETEFPNINKKFYVISNGKDEEEWFKKKKFNKEDTTSKSLLKYTEQLFTKYVSENWYKNRRDYS